MLQGVSARPAGRGSRATCEYLTCRHPPGIAEPRMRSRSSLARSPAAFVAATCATSVRLQPGRLDCRRLDDCLAAQVSDAGGERRTSRAERPAPARRRTDLDAEIGRAILLPYGHSKRDRK